jgi:hypothetical protein
MPAGRRRSRRDGSRRSQGRRVRWSWLAVAAIVAAVLAAALADSARAERGHHLNRPWHPDALQVAPWWTWFGDERPFDARASNAESRQKRHDVGDDSSEQSARGRRSTRRTARESARRTAAVERDADVIGCRPRSADEIHRWRFHGRPYWHYHYNGTRGRSRLGLGPDRWSARRC